MRKLIILVMVALFAFYACNKQSTDNEETEPPAVPPETTLEIDFSNFDTGSPTTQLLKTTDQQTAQNWFRAATMVFFWKMMSQVTMAVPTMAFKMAVSTQPQYEDNGWVWSHDFTAGQRSFNATLKAYKNDEQQRWDWEMYITSEGNFTDFEWFYGYSSFDGNSGGWTINKSPDEPNPLLDINWEVHSDSTMVIRWTIVDTSSSQYGSYIEFGTMTDSNYNAYFNLYDSKEDYTVEIQWNTTTKAGRIKDEVYFQDTNWHCWDENRQDVTCPQ